MVVEELMSRLAASLRRSVIISEFQRVHEFGGPMWNSRESCDILQSVVDRYIG